VTQLDRIARAQGSSAVPLRSVRLPHARPAVEAAPRPVPFTSSATSSSRCGTTPSCAPTSTWPGRPPRTRGCCCARRVAARPPVRRREGDPYTARGYAIVP